MSSMCTCHLKKSVHKDNAKISNCQVTRRSFVPSSVCLRVELSILILKAFGLVSQCSVGGLKEPTNLLTEGAT